MYGQHITISEPFASAVEKVVAALKNEGFGALSDIDIQKAMKEKLGADMFRPHFLGEPWRAVQFSRRRGCSGATDDRAGVAGSADRAYGDDALSIDRLPGRVHASTTTAA